MISFMAKKRFLTAWVSKLGFTCNAKVCYGFHDLCYKRMIYWFFQPLIQVQQSYTLTENSFSAKHSSSSLLLQTQLHAHPLELHKFYKKIIRYTRSLSNLPIRDDQCHDMILYTQSVSFKFHILEKKNIVKHEYGKRRMRKASTRRCRGSRIRKGRRKGRAEERSLSLGYVSASNERVRFGEERRVLGFKSLQWRGCWFCYWSWFVIVVVWRSRVRIAQKIHGRFGTNALLQFWFLLLFHFITVEKT